MPDRAHATMSLAAHRRSLNQIAGYFRRTRNNGTKDGEKIAFAGAGERREGTWTIRQDGAMLGPIRLTMRSSSRFSKPWWLEPHPSREDSPP